MEGSRSGGYYRTSLAAERHHLQRNHAVFTLVLRKPVLQLVDQIRRDLQRELARFHFQRMIRQLADYGGGQLDLLDISLELHGRLPGRNVYFEHIRCEGQGSGGTRRAHNTACGGAIVTVSVVAIVAVISVAAVISAIIRVSGVLRNARVFRFTRTFRSGSCNRNFCRGCESSVHCLHRNRGLASFYSGYRSIRYSGYCRIA
ncbi:hypothetical protein D3C75_615420 [compost metagenome]